MFNRLLTRLVWVATSLIGGPGAVVIAEPGADAPTVDARPRWRWVEPVALIAGPLMVALALGAPPAGIAVGGMIGLLIVLVGVARPRR